MRKYKLGFFSNFLKYKLVKIMDNSSQTGEVNFGKSTFLNHILEQRICGIRN